MAEGKIKKVVGMITSVLKKLLLPLLINIAIIIIILLGIFAAMADTDTQNDTTSNGTNTGSIVGQTIQEKVWWALKDANFSDEQIAAAMGNIQHESGFDPAIVEGGYNEDNGGIGLCQWTNSGRGTAGNNTNLKNYAKSKGTTWQDEETQVEFLVTYLTGKGLATKYTGKANMAREYFGVSYSATAWEKYKLTGNVDNDIDYLTRAFLANYEGPGASYAESSIDNRITYAKKYYKELHGKERPKSQELSSSTTGIYGYYKSSSGRTYTEYVQDISSNGCPWYSVDGCFHCSLATCMSAFGSKYTPNQLSGFSYGSGCYGNQNDVSKIGCSWRNITASETRTVLKKGDPIMFHVTGGTITTENGSKQHGGHWLVMMDYKKETGKDKVYIHDPWSTHADRGWGDLDSINSNIVEWYHIYKD